MFREGSSACLLNNRVEGVSSDNKDYLRDLEKVDEQNKIWKLRFTELNLSSLRENAQKVLQMFWDSQHTNPKNTAHPELQALGCNGKNTE